MSLLEFPKVVTDGPKLIRRLVVEPPTFHDLHVAKEYAKALVESREVISATVYETLKHGRKRFILKYEVKVGATVLFTVV